MNNSERYFLHTFFSADGSSHFLIKQKNFSYSAAILKLFSFRLVVNRRFIYRNGIKTTVWNLLKVTFHNIAYKCQSALQVKLKASPSITLKREGHRIPATQQDVEKRSLVFLEHDSVSSVFPKCSFRKRHNARSPSSFID